MDGAIERVVDSLSGSGVVSASANRALCASRRSRSICSGTISPCTRSSRPTALQPGADRKPRAELECEEPQAELSVSSLRIRCPTSACGVPNRDSPPDRPARLLHLEIVELVQLPEQRLQAQFGGGIPVRLAREALGDAGARS